MKQRIMLAAGALNGLMAVAMSALAAHGLEGQAAHWAGTAAQMQLAHGLALLATGLWPRPGRWQWAAAGLFAAGILLFCGGLYGAALWGWGTQTAPLGGLALMAGWLALAVAALR